MNPIDFLKGRGNDVRARVSNYIFKNYYDALREQVRYTDSEVVKKFFWVMADRRIVDFENRPIHDFECELVFGAKFTGSTQDLISTILYFFGVLENNLTWYFQEQLRPGDVFIDVGSHMGYFALLGGTCVGPKGTSVAIEASPATYARLKKNVEINPNLNIRAVNYAASDKEGSLKFYRGPDLNTGISSIRPREGSNRFEAEVPAKPLYKILKKEEIERARMMKIDVEGAEFEVMEGLWPMLKDAPQTLEIAVETSDDWKIGERVATVDDLIKKFRDHGFHSYAMKKEPFATAQNFHRPIRAETDPGWGYFDLVFSKKDVGRL